MTNLLSVITGGILTLLGGFVANRYLIKAQERKWEAEQTGLYNRETAKRLRKLYRKMAESATTIEGITRQRSSVSDADQTPENRDKRHALMLVNAQKQLSKVGGQIMIESAANTVREKFVELHTTFDCYLREEQSGQVGGVYQKKIRDLESVILGLANEIRATAQQHLKELDTPAKIARSRKSGSQTQVQPIISNDINSENN